MVNTWRSGLCCGLIIIGDVKGAIMEDMELCVKHHMQEDFLQINDKMHLKVFVFF